MMALASIVANHLAQRDIRVVLVGGLAVEIYTDNLYLTKDIDMVNSSYDPPAHIQKAMAEIGFHKQGRVYINETTDVCVEFPSATLAVGDQLIEETTTIKTEHGELPILFAADVAKDRLAAYFHWNDRQSLVQALAIMSIHSIKPPELKAFCDREGEPGQIEFLSRLWQQVRENGLSTMTEIEEVVVTETMKEL